MARVVEGSAVMRNNEALTLEEIAEGWVLTCQAVPTSRSVHVVYE
jgi:3-ketosteroid 9alpha-monooxygenase subunit B